MPIGKERSGEPTHAENVQPREVTIHTLILKRELTLYQSAADALTHAGLGTYRFTIDEQQSAPGTQKPIGENSPFVPVTYTYTRVGDNSRFWRIVERARATKAQAEHEGIPQAEIDQAIQNAIITGVHSELNREA